MRGKKRYKRLAQCRKLVAGEFVAQILFLFYMKRLHIYQTVCVDVLHLERCKLWPFVTLTAAYTRLCNQCAQHIEYITLNPPHSPTHTKVHKLPNTH